MIKDHSWHFAKSFGDSVDRTHVLEVDQGVEVCVDESDEGLGWDVMAWVLIGQKSSDALEHEASFSGQEVERYNQSVFDTLFVVLHAWNQGCGLQEWSNVRAFIKEMAPAIDFELLVSLRPLGQGI